MQSKRGALKHLLVTVYVSAVDKLADIINLIPLKINIRFCLRTIRFVGRMCSVIAIANILSGADNVIRISGRIRAKRRWKHRNGSVCERRDDFTLGLRRFQTSLSALILRIIQHGAKELPRFCSQRVHASLKDMIAPHENYRTDDDIQEICEKWSNVI